MKRVTNFILVQHIYLNYGIKEKRWKKEKKQKKTNDGNDGNDGDGHGNEDDQPHVY